MKRLLIAFLILFVLVGFTPAQAACPPPGLPSGFWGYITTNNPTAVIGSQLAVYDQGVKVAWTTIFKWQTFVVYSVIVRADDPCRPGIDGGIQGDKLTFKAFGQPVGTATWQGGTNVNLDLTINVPIWRR